MSESGGVVEEELTQEVISNSTQRNLSLKLDVTQYLSTDCVRPSVRNDDFSRRNIDHSLGEALLKFGVESLRDGRQDLDGR